MHIYRILLERPRRTMSQPEAYPPAGANPPPYQQGYPPQQYQQPGMTSPTAPGPGYEYPPQVPAGQPPPAGGAYNTVYPAPGQQYDGQQDPEAADKDPAEEDHPFGAFTEKKIRMGFIKKVFGILALQIIVTGGIMSLFMFWKPLRDYSYNHMWMYIAALCTTFVMIIVLGCCGDVRRKFPTNLICLGVFTLAMSWMLGTIASRFTANEILMSVGIVAAICVGAFILGLQTKIDFTHLVGILMCLTISLIMFGIFAAIFRSRIAYIGYASLGAFVFSLWLVVDIQLIMGGKHQYAIDPEEYIFAALNLYIDIVNLLLRIMILVRMLGGD